MSGTLHSRAYAEFLRLLRRARKTAGLTQAEVADALRVPQSFVSKSETGGRRVDVVELARFAALYDKPLDWFVPPAR